MLLGASGEHQGIDYELRAVSKEALVECAAVAANFNQMV